MDAPLPIRSGCGATSDPPMAPVRIRIGFTIVRIILGVLLLTAGGLKLADDGFGAASGFGLFITSQLLRLSQVTVEVFLGVWLLLGLAPRLLWLVTLLFFSMLAGVSLYLGIEGGQSCGCFGTRLPIQPWYTASLDTCAIAALLVWRPLPNPFVTTRPILLTVILVGIGGGAAGVFEHVAGILDSDRAIIGDDKTVVLYPENWVGKRLPLLPYIEIAEDLSAGEWLLLLVHSECPKCREVLPRFEQLAKDQAAYVMSCRIAVIDLPSFGASKLFPPDYPETFVLARGRLEPQREWITKTPVLIKIVDGVVVETDTVVRP